MNNSIRIRNYILLIALAIVLFPIGLYAKDKSTVDETVKVKSNCNWSDDQVKGYFGISVNVKKEQIITGNLKGDWYFSDGTAVASNHTYDFTKALNNSTYEGFGLPSVKVTMSLSDYDSDDLDCKFDYVKIVEEWTRTKVNKKQKGKCDTSKVEKKLSEIKKAKIDCDDSSKNYALDSFEGQFCLAYNNATTKIIGSGTKDGNDDDSKITYQTNDISTNGRFKKDKIYNTKCEYDISNEKLVPRNPDELTGDGDDALKKTGKKDYFVNKKYYFAQLKIKETYGSYKYYYVPGNGKNRGQITCTRVCSEAVVVEYGPPVAKKAGMCFEYKIRVTSRVDCHIADDGIPKPPDAKCEYCTPAPSCHGGAYKQGGPNDEYDACIQSCDNGKYTKKCSDKCYKKVYGTTATKSNASELNDDLTATKTKKKKNKSSDYGSLAHCKKQPKNEGGCYYVSGGIHWSPGYNNSAPGRWYRHNSWAATVSNPGAYDVREDGFYRHYYADKGDYCNGPCHWVDCRDDDTTYLNPAYAESDYKLNYEKWEEAVDSCNRQATCVTETSTYTISANYNDTWEIFPRQGKDKDKVSKSTSTEGNKYTSLLVDYSKGSFNKHNGIRGCYYYSHESGKEKERMYRSTWHFPGTWMNAKTGEISYDENKGAGWGEFKDKFCIPFNTEPVNSEWWVQFYKNRLKDASLNLSYKNPNIGSSCLNGKSNGIDFNTKSGPATSAIKWNIKGETRNFGYFGWNFDIECFYATPPYPITKSDKNPTNSKGSEDACTDDVRIRSIESSNLFPEKNGGNNTAITITSPTGSSAQVGRQPGFNWSQYATSQLKNEQYYSDPVKLIATIQSDEYIKQLYTDKYLDYQFKLSRDDLKKIRATSGGISSNYTNFDDNGFFLDSNGVLRYKSQKIRQYANKYPNDSALKCNNLRDSSHCEIGG